MRASSVVSRITQSVMCLGQYTEYYVESYNNALAVFSSIIITLCRLEVLEVIPTVLE